MSLQETKFKLNQQEAEEFVREKLNALEFGGLMELAKRIGKSYPTLNNFKNGKNKFIPGKLLIKCLEGLGYSDIKRVVEVKYTFLDKHSEGHKMV
jgi:hypothetical protein